MLRHGLILKKLILVFFIILAINSYAQNHRTLNDCTTFKELANQTVNTAQILRNNGNFKIENTAIELLTNTNQLLQNCPDSFEEKRIVLTTLIEFLIIRNDLEVIDSHI